MVLRGIDEVVEALCGYGRIFRCELENAGRIGRISVSDGGEPLRAVDSASVLESFLGYSEYSVAGVYGGVGGAIQTESRVWEIPVSSYGDSFGLLSRFWVELGLLASAESEILTIFDYSWSGLPRRELGIRRDWRDYGVRDQFWGVWGDLIDETFGERMEGASRERVVAIPKASSSRVVVEEFCRFVRRRCSGGTEWIERVELFTDVSLLGFLLEPGEYLAPMRVDLGRFDGYYGRELWCVYVYPRCGERVLRVEFFSGLDWFWALGVIDAQCVAGCREPLVQALVDREAKQRVGIVVREGEMRRELLVRRAGSALQARAYLQIFGAYRS